MPATPSQELVETFGTAVKPQTGRQLAAGPLTVVFSGGNIASICFRGCEVLRGISYLVRDENWGTCPVIISRPVIRTSGNRCDIRFTAEARNGASVLRYAAAIALSARKVEFTVTATPEVDFSTNRTGFVVLHPIEGVAGRPLTVTHTDGTREKARFPKLISPGQPFFDIRALEHAPAPGLKAHVLMEGHKFEMEDQRNWGDASYKTYVCSLLDPWPYVLKAGEPFTQKMTLTLSGTAKARKRRSGLIPLGTMRRNARLPQLGISITADDAAETFRHIGRLQELSPQFLLGLHEAGATTNSTLRTYAAVAERAAIPFRAEIVLSASRDAMAEMAEVSAAFREAGLSPQAVVVTQVHDLKSFQPADTRPWGPSYEEMAAAARKHFPGVKVGGGMISYFTELNRKQPPLGVFDFLTHSICPIVHDASDAAVMQTLDTLPHIFASARALMGDAPYHLGPTTIAARMNPYGKDVAANPGRDRICLAPNDPRQAGHFAAVWTLGLVAAAARARLDAVCLGPLCGPRGLLREGGAPSPAAMLFKALRSLHSGRGVHASTTSGLVVLGRGTQQTLIGNTTAAELHYSLAGQRHVLSPYRMALHHG